MVLSRGCTVRVADLEEQLEARANPEVLGRAVLVDGDEAAERVGDVGVDPRAAVQQQAPDEALDKYDTAKIRSGRTGAVCDIVGTGSDPLKTVNCSTPVRATTAATRPNTPMGANFMTRSVIFIMT